MKFLKKSLALVLTLALCLGLFASFAYAEDDSFSYLAIGDSTAQGYFTEGFTDANSGIDRYSSPNSYPFLLHSYLERTLGKDVNFYQYTLRGIRPNELYAILAPEEAAATMDGSAKYHVGTYVDAFKNVYDGDIYEMYPEAVRNADLITYDIGLNNVGLYLANRFMAIMNNDPGMFEGDSISMIYSQLDPISAATCDNLRNTVSGMIKSVLKDNSELVENFLDLLVYSYASFVLYYDKTIDIIYKENPDVEMIVFGMCNYLDGMVFTYDVNGTVLTLDFGEIMQTVYNAMNTHITGGNKYAYRYKYVDMSGGVENIIKEIASGKPTETTRNYIIDDLKLNGFTDPAMWEQGIEAYINASRLETLDLKGVMELLSSGGDMADCLKNCVNDYENASDADKSVMNIYERSICANGFGSHPSIKGGYQKYNLLIRAYESNRTASSYALQSTVSTGVSATNTALQIFKVPVLEKLNEIFSAFWTAIVDFFANLKTALIP